jgi:Tol biopolymer transport system component
VLEVVLLINFIFLAVAWLNVGFAQCFYLRNVKRNFKCGGLTLLVSPLVLLFIAISIPSEFHLNPTKFQTTSPFLPSHEQPKALKSQFQTPPTLEELNALKSIRGKIPGSIVWATSRHGTWEIDRMKADGTEKIRLTNDPHPNTHPLWSRDGRWIYFERDSDIYRMLPDGSNSHLIVQNGFSFALSHDDSRLVYVREEQGGCSILLFDLKKKKEEEIIPGRFPQFKGKQLRFPSLSPDGRQLAFSSDYPTPWTIHMVKPDGSEIFQFDNGCMLDYSPDGLMVTWVTGGYHEIYIGTPHGKTKQLFEGSIPGRPHCYFPRWSNDGQYIVFAASPSPDRGVSDYEIYIKPTRGGKAVRLTFHPATDTWPSLFIPHK